MCGTQTQNCLAIRYAIVLSIAWCHLLLRCYSICCLYNMMGNRYSPGATIKIMFFAWTTKSHKWRNGMCSFSVFLKVNAYQNVWNFNRIELIHKLFAPVVNFVVCVVFVVVVLLLLPFTVPIVTHSHHQMGFQQHRTPCTQVIRVQYEQTAQHNFPSVCTWNFPKINPPAMAF